MNSLLVVLVFSRLLPQLSLLLLLLLLWQLQLLLFIVGLLLFL